MRVARLHDESLVLMRWSDGQLASDFRLRLSTPEGEETWTLGPGLFGSVDEFAGKGLAFFEFQLRSLFEDHIPDPDRAPAGPDRAYDELPVSHDVSADVLRIVEGDPPGR